MTGVDDLQALLIGIRCERDSHKFFKKYGERFEDSEGKQIFLEFADEERAHPYLWRFWKQVPPRGGVAIFDRSWYGRVLVERVEGLCSVPDWMRAYAEINQFEEHLTEGGAIVVKFWLQISKAEQLTRFKARERTSFKRFKITPEDWRNRRKWGAYERAVCDMVDRTSTEIAPWTLVEAEDKHYARIKVLTTIVERLKEALRK